MEITTATARLARWYRMWRAAAGVQGEIIPSQAELWRAARGG
jgi:hypothetical protein